MTWRSAPKGHGQLCSSDWLWFPRHVQKVHVLGARAVQGHHSGLGRLNKVPVSHVCVHRRRTQIIIEIKFWEASGTNDIALRKRWS